MRWKAMLSVIPAPRAIEPEQYLHECLNAVKYDKTQPPFFFSNVTLFVSATISDVVSLDVDGNLVLKTIITTLNWLEPIFQWSQDFYLPQWKWKESTV